jgi:hypothetical protein
MPDNISNRQTEDELRLIMMEYINPEWAKRLVKKITADLELRPYPHVEKIQENRIEHMRWIQKQQKKGRFMDWRDEVRPPGAKEFLSGKPVPGVLQKILAKRDVVRFDPRTDEFGVSSNIERLQYIRRYNKKMSNKEHDAPTNLDYYHSLK